MNRLSVTLTVNGRTVTRAISANTTLLEFVRDELALTGTKRGCDLGECGCCAVLLNDVSILACTTLAVEVDGQTLTTIEGVADAYGLQNGCGLQDASGLKNGNQNSLHPIQEEMVAQGAVQCGFCSPAMVINTVAYIEDLKKCGARVDREGVKRCVSGAICRCTGYTKIESAVTTAAKRCLDTPSL